MGKIATSLAIVHMFTYQSVYIHIYIHMVVPTPLKSISQLGTLFQLNGEIEHVPNQQRIYIYIHVYILHEYIYIYIYVYIYIYIYHNLIHIYIYIYISYNHICIHTVWTKDSQHAPRMAAVSLASFRFLRHRNWALVESFHSVLECRWKNSLPDVFGIIKDVLKILWGIILPNKSVRSFVHWHSPGVSGSSDEHFLTWSTKESNST